MGDYDAALREFQVAYDLSQRPQLFYNLSLCYQQLGDLTQAATYLERYLNEVPEIPNRVALTTRLANLRERAARGETHAGDPETGETGTPDETTPDETTGGTEGGSAGGTTGGSAGGGATGSTDTGGESPNIGAITGFSIAALGVVGVAIFGALTLSENGSVSAGCGATGSCNPGQIGTLQTYALLTDISFGVALAGAVVGTVLLFVGGSSETAASAELAPGLRLAPLAGAGGSGASAGLLLDGSF